MHKSDLTFLFGYFFLLIALGTLLLGLPAASGDGQSVALVDALFTATSAVCVTGLVTIPTSQFSLLGQSVIMLLIQLGGLGIISFSTILVIIPGMKMSLKRLKFVNNYYLSEIEHDPRKIVSAIVAGTLVIQGIGVLLLYWRFSVHAVADPFYTSLFHTVSAFCNAGFSLYDQSLEGFAHIPDILLICASLFILGGISFIVIHEVIGWLFPHKQRRYSLSLHTQLVLGTTALLLALGTIAILVLEWNYSLAEYGLGAKLYNAFFQAATPRTAGFNSIPQSELQPSSILVTMVLMLIGGAPGSIAGGIKVTTFAVMLMVIIQGYTSRGHLHIFRREVDSFTIMNAFAFGVKALALLFSAMLLLALSESAALAQGEFTILQVMFESVSAFGTVGLSLGITSSLSQVGKLIIIATMLAGRLGLVSLAVPFFQREREYRVRYPRGEVLLG